LSEPLNIWARQPFESKGLSVDVIGLSVGNYVIESALAQGGMGQVFVARHPALGRTAAVKFLDGEMALHPEVARRFVDEARITASLRHPNIVDIFDFGDVDGHFYYVMELLEGSDLSGKLKAGRLSELETIDSLLQICSGLAAAHEAGVVHRDLKPQNIFVVAGDTLRLKIVDFGVAKLMTTSGEQTNYGQVLGTPAYMAPEQALGQIDRISEQSDLYALGAMAYEMLTGRPPFQHTAPMMLLVMHIHDLPKPLREVTPGLHRGLCELVERCLQKAPEDRPRSADALAEELRRLRVDVVARLAAGTLPSVLPAEVSPAAIEPGPPSARATLVGAGQDAISIRLEVPMPAVPTQRECLSSFAPSERPPEELAAALSPADKNVLGKLLARMKRRGDLPAFVQTVGEVNKKSDSESHYSATDLAHAITKDQALTVKLLQVVNSTYVNRFGGRVYTVQQAILILGFDKVRSIALSISVFSKIEASAHPERVADSAIHALVSGELARQIAELTRQVDPEQALVCAMFRNLGRHLVVVYLPDLFALTLEASARDKVSEAVAAERVLGISLRKIGIGVAERWHLPTRVIAAMAGGTLDPNAIWDEEDRLLGLSQFSNELSDLVATGAGPADAAMKKLLAKHQGVATFDDGALEALLGRVSESFRKRYASLLGKKVAGNRFLTSLLAHDAGSPPTPEAPPRAAVQSSADAERSGKGATVDLTAVLTQLGEKLKLTRLLALRKSPTGTELFVAAAVGEDAAGLKKAVTFPLGKATQDLFSKAYHSGRDLRVTDAFGPSRATQLPTAYFEALGSPCLVVLACTQPGAATTLVLCDMRTPAELPAAGELALLDELRLAVARARA